MVSLYTTTTALVVAAEFTATNGLVAYTLGIEGNYT